jgi:TolA-binding protein
VKGWKPAALVVVAIAALAPSAGLAQTPPEEQAARLLEDGRAYARDGKYKQALDNFNTIVTGFSNTASVDDALLEIGRYHAQVQRDYEVARSSFEAITQSYPQSDGAPGAYYYLGWLTMTQATTQEQRDDALAQFTRVQRLYPKSEWVPRAIHAAGLVERSAGRLLEAGDLQRRVAMEYPSSDAAPQAQYQIGHTLALQGEITAAMEEFQTVRNRYPQSDWAARALERITALYRFRGGRPSFRIDASFSLSAGDVLRDVRAILMAPDGALWVASNKTNSAVPFTDGRAGPSITGKDLASLSLTPDGEIVVTAKLAVRIGRRNIHGFTLPGQKPRPLEQLTSALVLPGGDVLVADKKRKGIFRFDSDYNYIGPFPDNREREITRLVRDEEGGIVCLDGKTRTIRIYDATGKPLRSIAARGSGYELKRPVDIAVDAALNIYVVDSRAGVFVIGRQGQLLATLGAGQLREPVALTLEPGGSVLVYDKKARQVFRFH